MITVRISGTDEEKTDRFADECFGKINDFIESGPFEDITVYPPAEPMLSKVQNRFRKNISLSFPKNAKVAALIKKYLFKMEKVSGVTVTFDVDPISEN